MSNLPPPPPGGEPWNPVPAPQPPTDAWGNPTPHAGFGHQAQPAFHAAPAAPYIPYEPGKGAKPETYLWQAIVVTLLCCLPFGIAAIVFASQVDSKWAMGDFVGASASSRKAKNFVIVSALCGLAAFIAYGVLFVAAARTSTVPSSY